MIHVGDCRLILPTLPADHYDAIVTDPPYELGFMGKRWDRSGIAFDVAMWEQVLRAAKPGAHLLAFGGTRTFHRLACAIEDAGWELRDCVPYAHEGIELAPVADCPWLLAWVYGSGFPKSKNIGDGWGTALKPAWEPIILARKPLSERNVAANVARWGTGAMNIDACRVLVDGEERGPITGKGAIPARNDENTARPGGIVAQPHELGRWPANLIHDGSAEVLAGFPDTVSGKPAGFKTGGRGNAFGEYGGGIPVTGFGDAGSAARFFYCAKADGSDRNDGLDDFEKRMFGMSSAAAAAAARGEHYNNGDGGINRVTQRQNHHPTVKPTDLMRWCCRLITPRGGLVLDPFAGSGSTGRGAIAEGFRFEGIELDPEYAAIADARTRAVQPGLAL